MDDAMTYELTDDELRSIADGNPWAALLAAILAMPEDAVDGAPDGEAEQAHG